MFLIYNHFLLYSMAHTMAHSLRLVDYEHNSILFLDLIKKMLFKIWISKKKNLWHKSGTIPSCSNVGLLYLD